MGNSSSKGKKADKPAKKQKKDKNAAAGSVSQGEQPAIVADPPSKAPSKASSKRPSAAEVKAAPQDTASLGNKSNTSSQAMINGIPAVPKTKSAQSLQKKPNKDTSDGDLVADDAPAAPVKKDDKNVTKATKGRLSVQADTSHLVSALEAKEQARAAKLFTVEEEKHSKIYKALNPDKLWFESRREREEAKEEQEDDEDVKLFVRSGDAFGERFQDADGNVIVAEDDEPYEDKVPDVIPTFDAETEAELKKLRAEREEKQKARQDKLRQEYLKKKQIEDAARQAEIDEILKKEEAKKKKEVVTDEDVKEVHKRLTAETNFGQFSWKK